ncbi:MAG: hypothetical protein JNN29_14740 [Chitinophagaceae bacterium]|nr:hypothetical protein [Chitinophagaceae bacterium]
MPSVSLYTGTSVDSTTAADTLVDTSKHRRYELCLSFAQTMIGDFFPTVNQPATHSLFSTLGHIACCIDSHLDALDLDQKEKLLSEFPVFFDQLPENDQEEAFTWHLSALCIKIGTALYPPSAASMLFRFYSYCRKNNLLDPLLAFSLAVIRSGIDKSKAQTPQAILNCLHEEGKAAIRFLLLLLAKENLIDPASPRYLPLQTYLSRLECMLNIADDLSDHRKDKKRGTISLPINLSYFRVLGKRLLHTFVLTIWSQPLLFPKHFIFFTGRYLSSEVGKSVNCTHARLPEGLERKTT